MEEKQYIIFSFYYINKEEEIDKILKYKYTLLNKDILTHEELYQEIRRYQKQYHYPVCVHEVLFYHNENEYIEMETDVPNDNFNDNSNNTFNNSHTSFFQNINYMKDLHLHMNEEHPFQDMDRIYVFFKCKNYHNKKSIKNRKEIEFSSKYTRRRPIT